VKCEAPVAPEIVELRPRHDKAIEVIVGQDRADGMDPRTTVGPDRDEKAEPDPEVVQEPAPCDRGHHRLTIDPAASNARAIAAYAKVGFRPVGIMRQYERGPDGTWHDGLLMELLREDL
jgi:hypothetical protein